MSELPTGVSAEEARAITITREELSCFPRCLLSDDGAPDPSLWVPVVAPWAPPDWSTVNYEVFRVKVLKARKWWATQPELPPNPLPADDVYATCQQVLDEGSATPVEVALDEAPPLPETAVPEAPDALAPAGTGDYVVASGDCLASIAFARGHTWQTLWEHPGNAELRRERGDPNVLLPGDELTIPPLRIAVLERPTGQRHRFRLKTTPAQLNIQLRWAGEARAGEPYELKIGGAVRRGVLGSKGELSEAISPEVTSATLSVGAGARLTELSLRIGALRPATSLQGAQSRLLNLGYLSAPVDGQWDERTRRAVRQFQRDAGLPETGKLDDATMEGLGGAHDVP